MEVFSHFTSALGRPNQRLPQINRPLHQVVPDIAQQQHEDALIDAARRNQVRALTVSADHHRRGGDLVGQRRFPLDLGRNSLDDADAN